MFSRVLGAMRYKTFIWPNNPSTCAYDVDRSYAKHKYPELRGVELEDMDPEAIILTGSGEFFGLNAYAYWNALNAIFNDYGVGEFYHPVYTDIKTVLMTKLKSNLEPRENYISYSFEFVVHTSMPSVVTLLPTSTTSVPTATSMPMPSATSGTIKVGDVVVCNGYAYHDSYGATPRSGLLTNRTMTVTYVNYKGSHPIHIGSTGWMQLSNITMSISGTPTAAATQTNYTVKAGDTLSAIGVKFGIRWQDIATLNNLKDPNLIYSGQTLKIPS